MASTKTVNYSPELTQKAIDLYKEGMLIDDISTAIGKSVRSVRSKLVREGVYEPPAKPVSKKAVGPTKKELLIEINKVAPFPTEGLLGATKDCLVEILNHYNEGVNQIMK